MRFDKANLANAMFCSCLLRFVRSQYQALIKHIKYESVLSCEEIDTSQLYKQYNNRVIFFIYVNLSSQLSVQNFSKVLMDLDCLSRNVPISRFRNCQKSDNICVFCKYYHFSLCKYWPPSDIFCYKQSRSIKNSEKIYL